MIKPYLILALMLLSGMIMIAPCECQYNTGVDTNADVSAEEKGTRTIEDGEITSMDWVAGTITVRWLEYDPVVKYNETTLSVPRDIKVKRGSETIGFDEIDQFDRVTIKYRKNKSASLPGVTSMTVTNPGY